MTRVDPFYTDNSLRVHEIPVGTKCPVEVGWPDSNKSHEAVNDKLSLDRFNKYGWLLDDTHLVIDIDVHHEEENGYESLAKLESDLSISLDEICKAVVESPSGGKHYYFTKPANMKFGKVFKEHYPGIDFIHGKGKQVVAAGSAHDSFGGTYAISENPSLTEVPMELVRHLQSLKSSTEHKSEPANFVSPDSERSGDEFNKSDQGLRMMVAQMQARGYIVRLTADGHYEWDRPNKTTGSKCSGFLGKKSKQGNYILSCFTLSDAHFDSGETVTIFYAFAQLMHKGDLKEAAKDLYELGFAVTEEDYSGIAGILEQGFCGAKVAQDDDEDEFEEPECEPEFPFEVLEDMPTYMKMAFDYSEATAIRFIPEASLLGIIALFSSVLGRRIKDDYNSRTNPIIIVLGGSGSGKNSQRTANKNLLVESGLSFLAGPERIGSPQGIISSVDANPSVLFQIDEVGEMLRAMNDERGPLKNLPGLIMHMYSDCTSTWKSDAVADLKRVKEIHQPNPVYYGTTVPDTFYENLRRDMATNGFFNRMLVINSQRTARKRPKDVSPTPGLLGWMKDWHEARELTPLDTPNPRLIPKNQAAFDMHELYTDAVEERHNSENELAAAIWSRAPEKEAKLTLVHAAANHRPDEQFQITERSVAWAKKIVNYSNRFMLWALNEKCQGSAAQVLKQRVLDKITTGMSQSAICRKTQFLRDRKERAAILEELIESKAIKRLDSGKFSKLRERI